MAINQAVEELAVRTIWHANLLLCSTPTSTHPHRAETVTRQLRLQIVFLHEAHDEKASEKIPLPRPIRDAFSYRLSEIRHQNISWSDGRGEELW
jgi:hypothetical protein